MEIAVFSDIHGNYVALQSCLKYVLDRKIDTFIFLGDYLGEFPYPQRAMEILYFVRDKYKCFWVRGNKEDYWINRKNSDMEWKMGTSSTGILQYCYSHLRERDLDFFSSLPVSTEIRPEGCQPILVCHGSPRKNNEKLLPNNENTESVLKGYGQRYVLCGHTHIQQAFTYDGVSVLNPGAVGVALRSGGKAQFMILRSDGNGWNHEFISIEYDKEQVMDLIRESGIMKAAPYWMQVTVHLMLTGEISHGTVLARAMECCKEETGQCTWYDIPEKYWERAVSELIGTVH